MNLKHATGVVRILVTLGISAIMLSSCTKSRAPKLIGIVQFVHQPLLDETERGVMAELTHLGLNDGSNYHVEVVVADKNFETSAQAVRAFLEKKAVLIIAIATPAAQAAAAQTNATPIVFAAITDPIGAKLVNTNAAPGKNLTGTSNRWPFEKQVALIRQVLPQAKKIGVVWNPSELNSQSAMTIIRPLLQTGGYILHEAPVASTAEVAPAAKVLATRGIDAFLMVPDNTVLAATMVLAGLANDLRIPLIGGDLDTVRKGSLASYGYDYFELGQVTARMGARILLQNAKPALMPVEFPPNPILIVNARACKTFGIEVPPDVLAAARETVR